MAATSKILVTVRGEPRKRSDEWLRLVLACFPDPQSGRGQFGEIARLAPSGFPTLLDGCEDGRGVSHLAPLVYFADKHDDGGASG